ncbi:hypothetical protein JIN85_12745 [Luteolibacter pohnpeiensis]|uniref:Acyl-protein synthetase LuxE domain-containing protein n=1 Tax=Luteolibacter pohnpeiensis TaxID=454153 RepID=A0A934SBU1_9BACT|nr:hypothetical protein [Luteolibacter pohnpeiensis]MBK1883287.1 hypothetical protein [Luteolibacter pohnpeiensis]
MPALLKQRLLDWMGGDSSAFASFNEAALEVFAYQFEHNASYRHYCEARGVTGARLTDWNEIPALPTDAFKFPAHQPRCFPAENATRYFLTSGTTREVRGRHEFEDLELYERSILAGWSQLGLPEIRNPWFLSQSPSDAPNSSLVHMFEVLDRSIASERWMIDLEGHIDTSGFPGKAPVELFSTALALLKWTECNGPTPLAEGSWIFETGGYKGLRETMEPERFREKVAAHFSIPVNRILNEYSMTELSSQFYRWPDEEGHRGPHWTRIRVINPETGAPAGDGEPGYLEILDLANLGSVAAIRTQDLAIARGPSSFTLLGRDPGALPRGCSRAADDLLNQR